MQGYADRQLPTKSIRHIAALVSAPAGLAPQIQSSVVEEAQKRGIAAQDAFLIFPPTRSYSNEDIRRGLAQSNIDAVLTIQVGDTGVISQYAGTIFQSQTSGTFAGTGTATTFGNSTNISIDGVSRQSTFGSATPIYRHSRRTAFHARLIEASSGRTLWIGNGQVSASGRFFVGDRTSASSSISAIFDDLQQKQILGPTS
jgi:hypothetical protein